MNTKSSRIRSILFGAILLAFLLGLSGLAGFAGYNFGRNFSLSEFSFQPASPVIQTAGATDTLSPGVEIVSPEKTALPQAPLETPISIAPSLTPWDGAGRVTVLLMGLDYRDWAEQRDYSRSDTMILLTLDPATKTAGILSIPRDMWVAIPGFTHGKINTAYYLGEAYKLPGGGPALATKTVEQFLGVPINYFAQIDFGAFVRFIDEIGGVEVDVPNRIVIDMLGGEGVKTKKILQPGRQALPGEWALAYARARYTENGDFDRAGRQQQVIMGIRERMLNPKMLTMIIQKAPALYRELASGIHTNLGLDDVIRLALAAKDVTKENIKQGILGKETVLFGFSPDNLSILVPIPDRIHLLRDQIFTTSGSMRPATQGDVRQRMQAEAARLGVYNGSSDPSLAVRTVELLTGQGAQVTESGDSDQAYSSTTIIDYSGSPFTVRYLVDLFDKPYIKVISRYQPDSPVDVEIFLGADWANINSLP